VSEQEIAQSLSECCLSGWFIEPTRLIRRQDVPEACVLCFFGDMVDSLRRSHRLRIAALFHVECGTFPLFSLNVGDARVGLFHCPIGAPAAAGFLEELIAAGCSRFVACGGAGVLRPDITVGHVIVPDAAVRDEGMNYHYLPPSRMVLADEASVAALVGVLERRHVPYLRGMTWTTDACYRSTAARDFAAGGSPPQSRRCPAGQPMRRC
jgi:hypothetical protein